MRISKESSGLKLNMIRPLIAMIARLHIIKRQVLHNIYSQRRRKKKKQKKPGIETIPGI